jgi:hypothetical protein
LEHFYIQEEKMATTNKVAMVLIEPEEMALLPKFTVAEVQLEKLNAEVFQIERQARDLVIKDVAGYTFAAKLTARRKEIEKEAEALVDPYKKPLRKAINRVQEALNVVINHGQQMKNILDAKMAQWNREETKRAAEEQQREQQRLNAQVAAAAEAKKKADLLFTAEQKKMAIKELKRKLKAGEIGKRAFVVAMKQLDASAEAAAEQAELDAEDTKANVPEVKVEPLTPTAAGVTRRTYYYANCVDRATFIRNFIDRIKVGDESLLPYIMVDDAALTQTAQQLKDSNRMATMFPGVKAWDKQSF